VSESGALLLVENIANIPNEFDLYFDGIRHVAYIVRRDDRSLGVTWAGPKIVDAGSSSQMLAYWKEVLKASQSPRPSNEPLSKPHFIASAREKRNIVPFTEK
jgi:hypothetical protein